MVNSSGKVGGEPIESKQNCIPCSTALGSAADPTGQPPFKENRHHHLQPGNNSVGFNIVMDYLQCRQRSYVP